MRTAAGQNLRAASARGGGARPPRRLPRALLRQLARSLREEESAGGPPAAARLIVEPVAPRRVFVEWRSPPDGRRARPLVLRLWCWQREGDPFYADLPLPADAGSRTLDVRFDAAYAAQLGRLRASGTLRVEAVSEKVETPPAGPSEDWSLVVCDLREPVPDAPRRWRQPADFPPVRLPRFGNPAAGRTACPAVPPAAMLAQAATTLTAEAAAEPAPCFAETASGAGGGAGEGWPCFDIAGQEAAG